MRILLVSQEYPPETGWGGIGTYTYHLAHGLNQAGHRVQVLSLAPTGRYSISEQEGVSIHRFPNVHPLTLLRKFRLAGLAHILGWSWTVSEAIARLWRQVPPDIIEAPLWDAESLVYSLHPCIPLVIRAETPHTEVARVSGFDRRWWAVNLKASCWVESVAARRATLVIAISQAIAHTIKADYRVSPDKIRIGYLGIPMPQRIGRRFNTTNGVTFLYVGRLEPRKGIQFLLQAIPRVVAALPNARFLIVGKDMGMPLTRKSYRSYFEEIADANALAATTFLGFVERSELEQLYDECDVFVAPSLYESLGLVHLEAMAYGKPVVAFRSGATPEIVQDGVTGLLVEPGDIDALVDALIRLGCERSTREQMGANGTRIVRSRFSVSAMVERTLEIYEEAIRLWHNQHRR